MAYPFSPRRSDPAPSLRPSVVPPTEWRCIECGKLLGVRHGARLHIRLQRHNYLVSLPVEAVCPSCAAENQT